MEVVAQSRIRNIAGLTSLRFFGAIAVVFYHTMIHWNIPGLDELWKFSRLGSDGVNLFFVLSGFILFYVYEQSLENGNFKARTFLGARIARIYPVYLVGLVLALPGFIARLLDTGIGHANGMTAIAAPLLVQAWAPGTACGWNCPGWSLSAEIFFYLLFPFIGMHLIRQSRRTILLWLLAAYAMTLAMPIAYLVAGRPIDYSDVNFDLMVLRFNPALRLPEFVFGMIIARLTMSRSLPVQRLFPPRLTWLIIGGVVATLYASYYLPTKITDTVVQNGFYVPLFALLIVAIARCSSPLLDGKWLVRLGEASYALYILHMPFWGMFQFAARKGLIVEANQYLPLYLCYLALTIGSSLLVNRYVENPCREMIQAWFRDPRRPPIRRMAVRFFTWLAYLRWRAFAPAGDLTRMYIGIGFDGGDRRS
jgi:peptidoglycan/LPS O-acetylase OafA/YrhL